MHPKSVTQIYLSLLLIQFNISEITNVHVLDRSDYMLPGICQNKGKTKIKCLNKAFGVTRATRMASVWLGSGCCKWLNSTGRMPQHSSASTSLLLCFVGCDREGFSQDTSTLGIWCLLKRRLHVNCLSITYRPQPTLLNVEWHIHTYTEQTKASWIWLNSWPNWAQLSKHILARDAKISFLSGVNLKVRPFAGETQKRSLKNTVEVHLLSV